MINNELYKGNSKPVIGKIPEAGKHTIDNDMKIDQAKHRAEEGEYVGDSAMKNDLSAKLVAGDKQEVLKPVGDGSVKRRIEDAWDTKQPDAINPAPEKSEIGTPTAKQSAGQTPAVYPDV